MSVICQLPLPYELQEFVRGFVYYSKKEAYQRLFHKRLMRQLNYSERLYWDSENLHFEYFHFKYENWKVHHDDVDSYFVTQHIYIMSSVFCKYCHNYITSYSPAPFSAACGCLYDQDMDDIPGLD
jgi:hypothetical protein